MPKHDFYGPFRGVKDALSLLTMLTDKDQLAKVTEIIKNLEQERVKINESIEIYGKANEIDTLHVNVKAQEDLWTKKLEELNLQIETEKERIRKERKKFNDTCIKKKKALDVREQELSKKESDFQKYSDDKEKKLQTYTVELDKLRSDAAIALKEAKISQQRWEKALDLIKKQAAEA